MKKSKNNRFKRFTAFLFRAAIWFVILVLGFVFLLETAIAIKAKDLHDTLKESFLSTEKSYVYAESEDEADVEMIDKALEKVPAVIAEEIKSNWLILISSRDPQSDYFDPRVLGTTYIRSKIIWLSVNFTEEALIHEVGHAFAAAGGIDCSGKFTEIYESFWDNYEVWYDYEDYVHRVSTPSELFAFLFERYVYDPVTLQEDFPEGYEYISDQLLCFDNWTRVFNPLTKNYNALDYFLDGIRQEKTVLDQIEEDGVQSEESANIDPKNYAPVIQFSGLKETEEALLSDLFSVIDKTEDYEIDIYSDEPIIKLECEKELSSETYNKVKACLDIYFGCEGSDLFYAAFYSSSGTYFIHVRVDVLEDLKRSRKAYVENTEAALAELREGTETEKLLRISRYISENCRCVSTKHTSADDFWSEHRGDGLTYALVFRLFCERLGIPCDIVFGTFPGVGAHAWNRVRLSDGSFRYYDVARYEEGKIDMPYYDDGDTIAINGYIE